MFAIPVSPEGIQYAGERAPDMHKWGPTAFTVAADGTFWIADTVGNRLLHFDPDGAVRGAVDLSAYGVVGIGDVEASGLGLVVLDTCAPLSRVLDLTADGGMVATYDVPEGLRLEDGLSGLAVGDRGEIVVERKAGALLSQLVDAQGVLDPVPLAGYLHEGQLYSARPADLTTQDTSAGYLIMGSKQLAVSVPNMLAGLWILGFTPDGGLYVVVEEMVSTPAISVDQTVRLYSPDGGLLGMARVPLDQQYTYVQHGLAVGPDGSAYALLTHPDRIEVVRLGFSSVLETILPTQAAATSIENTDIRDNSGGKLQTCRQRSAMLTTANQYKNNTKYLNATNTDGTCPGRGKPRYIQGPGTYPSVPYDWGGFDTVSSYNGYMDPNTYKAGDIDTVNPIGSYGVEPCSKGVDCAGFVSRVWGLTAYHNCTELEDSTVSCRLTSTAYLVRGDIMNDADKHVVWFDATSTGGIIGYESTTDNHCDRVVRMFSSWARLPSYLPRRYCNVCGTDTCGIPGVSFACSTHQ